MILDNIIKKAPIGIIISNEGGEIQSINTFAENVFGYTELELCGKSIEKLVPTSRKKVKIHTENNAVKDIQIIQTEKGIRTEGLRKDGTTIPLEIRLSTYIDQGQIFVVSYVNDLAEIQRNQTGFFNITEKLEERVKERTEELTNTLSKLKIAHRELEHKIQQKRIAEKNILVNIEKERELNELKSRFVSMASHEFRTPLAGILTSTSLAEVHFGNQNKKNFERHIHNIKKSVHNLTLILEDFLSTDRLDQGRVECRPSVFSLKSMIIEILESFSILIENRNITIQYNKDDIVMFQNQNMLRNILINLISNAIKYTPEKGGRISIITDQVKCQLILTVSDQGIGIPDDDQKYLFQRFFRAKNVQNIKGTGLGLNIISRYLIYVKGTIEFKSKENIGSCFTIKLPLEIK